MIRGAYRVPDSHGKPQKVSVGTENGWRSSRTDMHTLDADAVGQPAKCSGLRVR